MEAKYTKGPWEKAERLNGPWWHISSEYSVGGKVCIGGRQAIAAVHGESKKGSAAYAEMFEANARLISAAPDLLEALQMSRAYIASRCGTPDPEDRFADKVLIEIHKQIDAAIAKALGN